MTPPSPAPLVRTPEDAVIAAFEALPGALRDIVERSGVVFDKWPPPDDQMPPWGKAGREPWTPERLAALDPEVRWQGIAFSLYTEWVIGPLGRAIDELKEARAARPAGSGAGELDARKWDDLVGLATDEIRSLVQEGWSSGSQRRAIDVANSIDRRAADFRRLRERAATGSDHQHQWVDATNEVVSGTELCPICGAFRPMAATGSGE